MEEQLPEINIKEEKPLFFLNFDDKSKFVNESENYKSEFLSADSIADENVPEKDVPDFVNVNLFADNNTKPKKEQKEIYQCPKCPSKYSELEYLHIHEHVHDAEKLCPYCDLNFRERKRLSTHLNGHIKEKIEREKKKNLQCKICQKEFRTKRCLTVHIRVHTNERPFKCDICGKAFKQRSNLNDHSITHTNIKPFPCKECEGSFTTSSSLKRHLRRVHEAGKIYECKICGEKFLNVVFLRSHRYEYHPDVGKRVRKCAFCGLGCQSFNSYKKHLKTHEEGDIVKDENNQNHVCNLCGTEFSDMETFSEHRNQHLYYSKEELERALEKKLYKCKLCSKSFTAKSTVFKHMSLHLKRTFKCEICQDFYSYFGLAQHKASCHLPYDCKICRLTFIGRKKFVRHNDDYHPTLYKKYFCYICEKPYRKKGSLQLHIKLMHSNTDKIYKYGCKFCGLKFYSKQQQYLHRSTHLRSKSFTFKCRNCDAAFISLNKLRKHSLKIHHQTVIDGGLRRKVRLRINKTRDKFRCKICMKIFQSSRNYTHHVENEVCVKFFEKIKMNHNEVFKCVLCENQFATRRSIVSHQEVHWDCYKQCRFCGNTYRKASSARRHLEKSHSGEKLYHCKYCNVSFDHFAEMKQHYSSDAHIIKTNIKNEPVEKTTEQLGITENVKTEELQIKEEVDLLIENKL